MEIILCEYPNQDAETENEIKKNGCDEDRIVMRQVIGALLAPDASEESKSIELYLLYPVSAGSHGVYVVVDPLNEIVETSERDNVQAVSSWRSSKTTQMIWIFKDIHHAWYTSIQLKMRISFIILNREQQAYAFK